LIHLLCLDRSYPTKCLISLMHLYHSLWVLTSSFLESNSFMYILITSVSSCNTKKSWWFELLWWIREVDEGHFYGASVHICHCILYLLVDMTFYLSILKLLTSLLNLLDIWFRILCLFLYTMSVISGRWWVWHSIGNFRWECSTRLLKSDQSHRISYVSMSIRTRCVLLFSWHILIMTELESKKR
jgi:hypothetical protein